MIDIKVNLSIALPGSVMYSKQECFKQLKEVAKYKNGKVIKDKKTGKVKYVTKLVADPEKFDHKVMLLDNGGKEPERVTIHTRKCKPARQVLNMSTEAYNYMVSEAIPAGFKAPVGVKPTKKKSAAQVAWEGMTQEDRLLWHLNETAAALGGTLEDYQVFGD